MKVMLRLIVWAGLLAGGGQVASAEAGLAGTTRGVHTTEGKRYAMITGQVWKSVAKPDRYDVVEKAGDGVWKEINPYTNLIPGSRREGTVGGMERLSFRGNLVLPQGAEPKIEMRLRPRWPSEALVHPAEPVRKGNWQAHNNAHVESLIPKNEFGRNLFDRYDARGGAQWARWCWTNQMDFTGVSFSDGGHHENGIARLNTGGPYPKWECSAEVIMVTPVHGVFAAHWKQRLAVGSEVVFYNREGGRVVRKISGRSPKFDQMDIVVKGQSPTGYDVGVVRLEAPVPEGVKVYRLFAPHTAEGSPGTETFGAKVILLTRELEAFPYRIHQYPATMPMVSNVSLETPPGTPAFYQVPDRGFGVNRFYYGDSGGPVFLFYKGEPIFMGTLSGTGGGTPAVAGSCTNYLHADVFERLKHRVAELGGGYEVRTVSLEK